MPEEDPMDRYERIRAEHERLVQRFRAWGGAEEEAADAHHFLDWLGPLPTAGPTERDVMEFLWGWVPRKYGDEEDLLDGVRAGVARFLEFLAHEGGGTPAALRVAGDRESFLGRVRSFEEAGPSWFEELGRALEATGLEPFAELPDGFVWGGLQGRVESEAYDLLKARLAVAVRTGEIDAARPGWRAASALLQTSWLDAPQRAFGGRTPRAAVAAERAEQGPRLAPMIEGMRVMQEEGMFRGLPLEGEWAPAPTGLEEEPRFPLVAVPSEAEAQAAAAASPLVSHVRALVDLLGEGRPLTAKNWLTLADARALAEAIGKGEQFDPVIGHTTFRTRSSAEVPAVDLSFRWARSAGFVKVAHHRAEPTKRGRRLGEDPLDDWRLLFWTFAWKLEWPRRRWPEDRVPFWAEDVSSLIPGYLEELYQESGEPLPLRDLAERTTGAIAETYDLSWMTEEQGTHWPGMLAGDMWHGVFVPLAELGAVELSGERPLRQVLGDPEDEDTRAVRATPLGLWAIRRVIEFRWGSAPPAAGDLAARADGAEALLALGAELDLAPEELTEEARRYRERRGPAAADELAALLARGGPDVLAVQACLAGLDPAEVAPAVRAAARSASGGGALQCAAWLEDHGFEAPDVEVTVEALADVTVWTVVAVARGDGPEGVGEALGGMDEGDQLRALEAIGRLESPFAVEALEAVAAGSPLPPVRKAARKALHRQRTRGR